MLGLRPPLEANHSLEPNIRPTVSIVMVCHNGAAFLPATLTSLVQQSLPEWELLFWDNASVDESASIAGHADKRVRLLGGPQHLRVDEARNRAAREASGRLLAFLDADDVWFPDKLRAQVELCERSGTRFSFSECAILSPSGERLGLWSGRFPPSDGEAFQPLLLENFIVLSSVMMERALFQEMGGFDSSFRMAGDYDLWLRVARRERIAYDPIPRVGYRVHPGNLSLDYGPSYRENRRIYRRLLREGAMASEQAELVRAALVFLMWKWAVRTLLQERRPGRAWYRARAGLRWVRGPTHAVRLAARAVARLLRKTPLLCRLLRAVQRASS